eukprot:TRINITY_DN64023_c0_g2_i1.p1 TRINITY_DN64023_c0_g2~~TRINITY_DN64023_c0_g2_i1.p1  ORF type:complete len:608 (+),score=56.29 TRINITY_DN64023_c0_g2_i1:149-1825(+)
MHHPFPLDGFVWITHDHKQHTIQHDLNSCTASYTATKTSHPPNKVFDQVSCCATDDVSQLNSTSPNSISTNGPPTIGSKLTKTLSTPTPTPHPDSQCTSKAVNLTDDHKPPLQLHSFSNARDQCSLNHEQQLATTQRTRKTPPPCPFVPTDSTCHNLGQANVKPIISPSSSPGGPRSEGRRQGKKLTPPSFTPSTPTKIHHKAINDPENRRHSGANSTVDSLATSLTLTPLTARPTTEITHPQLQNTGHVDAPINLLEEDQEGATNSTSSAELIPAPDYSDPGSAEGGECIKNNTAQESDKPDEPSKSNTVQESDKLDSSLIITLTTPGNKKDCHLLAPTQDDPMWPPLNTTGENKLAGRRPSADVSEAEGAPLTAASQSTHHTQLSGLSLSHWPAVSVSAFPNDVINILEITEHNIAQQYAQIPSSLADDSLPLPQVARLICQALLLRTGRHTFQRYANGANPDVRGDEELTCYTHNNVWLIETTGGYGLAILCRGAVWPVPWDFQSLYTIDGGVTVCTQSGVYAARPGTSVNISGEVDIKATSTAAVMLYLALEAL